MVYTIESSIKTTNNKLLPQWIAASGVLMLMTQIGILSGWTSPNIIRLTSPDSPIPIDLSQASWIAAFLSVGRFLGAVMVPFMIDMLGSKKTILLTFFPIAASWILVLVVNNVVGLYVARAIGGIGFALAYGVFSIYLAEVTIPSYRGTMISFSLVGGQLGNVIGTVCETYLTMDVSSSIYLAMCILGIVLFAWLPESPHHLVKKSDTDSARKSVTWYQGSSNVENSLNEIKSFVECNSGQTLVQKLKEFKSPPMRKALFLAVLLYMYLQLCGIFSIMFYMEAILTNAKSFLVEPKQVVIYANMLAIFATLLALRLIDKLGRRILLIISSAGTTIALVSLGLHFYLLDAKIDPQRIEWLALASIFMFMASFTIGLNILPGTVMSEIFPSNIKSIAACVASLTSALGGFASSKSYQPMVDAIGEAYVFWTYAAITITAIPCALFYLPETKGKTFQEIQDILFKR